MDFQVKIFNLKTMFGECMIDYFNLSPNDKVMFKSPRLIYMRIQITPHSQS